MNHALSENITKKLFQIYQSDIINVRDQLFASIEKRSELLAQISKGILSNKLKDSNYPLWGEIYPWMISELTGISKEDCLKISTGWLAIYIHSIYIDQCLDKNIIIQKEELLASSLLAKEGLLNLYKIVNNTKYEKLFEDSLSVSANYELFDVLNKLNFDRLDSKEEIAVEKNRLILACAGAFAALDTKNADYIISLTNSLLLSLQYLDDVTDFYEDFNDGNFSYLLAYGLGNINAANSINSKEGLLEKLIISNSLLNTLIKIKGSVDATITILSERKTNLLDTNAYAYFILLHSTIGEFIEYLKKNGGIKFEHLFENEKRDVLREVLKRMYICNITT
jgi:hypothetical protein